MIFCHFRAHGGVSAVWPGKKLSSAEGKGARRQRVLYRSKSNPTHPETFRAQNAHREAVNIPLEKAAAARISQKKPALS
jgi:hypothetical protein